MKSTWSKSERLRRFNMALGFALFVVGVAIAEYCGYMERYVGEPQSEFVKLASWAALLAGLVLFVFGILQGPIDRQEPPREN